MRVLHIQTRAYPTLHEKLGSEVPGSVPVGRFGSVEPLSTSMTSMAYGRAPMVVVDLKPLFAHVATPDGVEIVDARLRALWSGAVLVSYALDAPGDLLSATALEIADHDAEVNRDLRIADEGLIGSVLSALDEHDVLLGVDWPGRPFSVTDEGAAGHHYPGEVRYNCHLIADELVWRSDPRTLCTDDLVGHSTCRVLLPYTFAWKLDAGCGEDFDRALGCLEGTDVAVAQRSVLAAASNDGVRMLEHLADTEPGDLELGGYRRYLDRIRSCYHRLDSYRYDSSQERRGAYLAARTEMDLDGIHDRAESLLQRVGESLAAAVNEQTQILDHRLDRVAAVLTVVAGGSFLFDTINFLRGAEPTGTLTRQGIVIAVWVLLVLILLLVMLWRRRPQRVLRND